jgi:hypothetical protein
MDLQTRTPHLLHRWLHLRVALSHTLTQHSTPTLLPEQRDTVSPQKVVARVSLLGVDQTPLLPPKAGLNLNPGSYQSDEQGSKLVLESFQVPLCNQNSPPRFTRRETPSPQINTSEAPGRGGTPSGHGH